MSEEEKTILIKKVQEDSNELALETLVLAYENMIFKVAHKYSKVTKIEIEDLIQEGYLAFIEAVRSYVPNKTSFDFFIFTSIKYKVINLSYKNNFIKYSDIEDLENLISTNQGLDANLKPFLFEHINRVLNQKEALVVKWRFGLNEDNWLTIKEISNITSISERIIYEILERSLKKLKKSIRKENNREILN